MPLPAAWYASSMSGGRIIPIDSSQPEGEAAADTRDNQVEPLELTDAIGDSPAAGADDSEWFEEATHSRFSGLLAPVLATLAIGGWTGLFVWANLDALRATPTPGVWVQSISTWSMPVLLCLVALLLALRLSKREAARFNDAARGLSLESQRLEQRLTSVNTELSLARNFIASQSRDLEALGRIAVERITGSAARLQELVVDNGAQVDRIATVSVSALDNMEKLRGQLPVIANAAKDVTNNIAGAGRTAHVELESLVAGFQRLNEFGVASERQVDSIRRKVNEALAAFEAATHELETASTERFAALTAEGEAFRQRLDQDEIAALAAIRARADHLATELDQHRVATMAAEAEALDALQTRFDTLRDESGKLGEQIAAAESDALKAWYERSAAHADTTLQSLGAVSRDHEAVVAQAMERLAGFEDSARSLVSRIEAEARRLDDELSRRRASTEASASEQRAALTRRLTEIDDAILLRRQAMEAAGAEAADALAAKLAELDQVIDEQRRQQMQSTKQLAAHCDQIAERVVSFSLALRASGEQGGDTAQAVDQALGLLNQRLAESRDALSKTDTQIGELTLAAVRLLELIQVSGEHTRTQLPEALRSSETGLKGIEDRVFMLRDTLREAGDSGRTLSEDIVATRGEVRDAIKDVGRFQEAFLGRAAEQQISISELRQILAAARGESEELATQVDQRLTEVLTRLSSVASGIATQLREGAVGEIEEIANRLGDQSGAAIVRVLQGRGAELVGKLEKAIDAATLASRDTVIQMRDQLSRVDDLAGNLEARVERLRERATEQVDNDFARRVALITESLNSTSIDIAKALSTDVSETAWAAYLRGDRGIFTRRAVSLIDNGQAKAIQSHYERNHDFRENVNHYIHDFEAMLRQLLSTRDGNALGVTLLSSDMGKLYVALAQGIERLRG